MKTARSERLALCDLLAKIGPDAPTLCEGWTTHDLAAHLWIRESDPLGAPGIVAKPLAGLTDRRMDEARTRWSYDELVARLRKGPAPLSLFAIPGLDEEANTVEYFIHHEDVRRAGAQVEPRALPAELEDWMWRRLSLMARALFRRCPVGVALEREGQADQTIRAARGSQIVTVVGQPSELMLYAYGRRAVAKVRLIGDDEALAALAATDLSL